MPRPAVSLMESGQRKVDALELKKLAELYQRPVADFTGTLKWKHRHPKRFTILPEPQRS